MFACYKDGNNRGQRLNTTTQRLFLYCIACTSNTVNSEIFARIVFPRIDILVNDRVILSFCEGLIFTKLRICEVSRKYNPRENFRIYSTHPA